MENHVTIRKIIQTLAVIFFIVQFQQSVRKYFQGPRVIQTSKVPAEDLPAPVVYICQADQFDNDKAQSNGYFSYENFMLGIMNKSIISWKGINSSYQDLENQLFNYNYTTLVIWTLAKNKWNLHNQTDQMNFLIPHGVCKKLTGIQPSTKLYITSTKRVTVLFVDSARANLIRSGETLHSHASFGPSSTTHYDEFSYTLQYSVNDDRINDGTSCTNYEKLGKSYGKCLENNLNEDLKTLYGCIPPWLSNTQEQVCQKNIPIEDYDAYWEKPILNDLLGLLTNKEPDMFKRCLPPCKTTNIELQKVLHRVSDQNVPFIPIYSTNIFLKFF